MFFSSSLKRSAVQPYTCMFAMLAWLLMAVTMPIASVGMALHGGGMAKTVAVEMSQHPMTVAPHAHASHCCGKVSCGACHCDAMCGGMMLPSVPALFALAWGPEHYVPMRSMDTPGLDPIPPLRPPAA